MSGKSQFKATILSIFPEIFPGTLGYSLAGQALRKGIWECNLVDIKQFGRTKHNSVDDEPYGGGNGLVMRADVLGDAIDEAIKISGSKKIYYMSPRGKPFNQALAHEIASEKNIIILCGRFEGIDERIIDEYNATEISVGDFVLSGGELAAMVVLDACIRLLPGVLSNQETLLEESFSTSGDMQGLLEYPLYTRPAVWRGRDVPEVLVSGDHARVQKWRLSKAKEITAERRPEIIRRQEK